MQIVFEILPIILFFIAYKFFGIYIATAVAIVVSLMQILGYRLVKGKIDRIQLLMLGLIVILGSATLLLHRPIFIKWKPTVVNWLFALLFLLSRFIGKKVLIQRMLGDKVSLPQSVWYRLNNSWGLFFLVMGSANLYVAYCYSTPIWVNFKLFGVLGLTFLFAIIQAIYLTRHIDPEQK